MEGSPPPSPASSRSPVPPESHPPCPPRVSLPADPGPAPVSTVHARASTPSRVFCLEVPSRTHPPPPTPPAEFLVFPLLDPSFHTPATFVLYQFRLKSSLGHVSLRTLRRSPGWRTSPPQASRNPLGEPPTTWAAPPCRVGLRSQDREGQPRVRTFGRLNPRSVQVGEVPRTGRRVPVVGSGTPHTGDGARTPTPSRLQRPEPGTVPFIDSPYRGHPRTPPVESRRVWGR